MCVSLYSYVYMWRGLQAEGVYDACGLYVWHTRTSTSYDYDCDCNIAIEFCGHDGWHWTSYRLPY